MSTQQVIPKQVGNFELIVEDQLEFAKEIRLAKWRSKETGLKVVWADVEGPLVQGQFSVVTEIFDDSGRPHTLEHLIFMGSEKYPYKGVLDTLANRQFANGTNAWTDTTNTTYTVGTAGAEGFLGILPVFLDHVLYPTITSAGFVTEVHNVNGKGEDSGVVYSEMQGRENGSGDLMQLRLQRALFDTDSAYRSETGGLMEALRQLSAQSIRDYHASAYLPHNITLIVAGRSLSPTALLETLQAKVEPSIVAHHQNNGPRPQGWKRPFVESSTAMKRPVIAENKSEIVEFPERDESVGEVMMSWVGVGALDFVGDLSLEVLGEYLTESAVSPLYAEFVEIEEPLCTDISFYSSTQDPSILTAYLSSVPSTHLETIEATFKAALGRIAKEGIDMTRMATILERQRLQLLEAIETDAADTLSSCILTDALFGAEDGSDLGPSMTTMSYYDVLAKWTSAEWSILLNQYYANGNSITIIGKPSASLADSLEKDEKARIAATVARLGVEGLAKLAKDVEAAQVENDQPVPAEMISAFKVPDVNAIEWIHVDSARSNGVAINVDAPFKNQVQDHVDADGAELPLFIQFDQINSNFVEISIHLFFDSSLKSTADNLRSLLPIYLDSFFSLPVTRADGTVLDFESVVRTLDAETLSYTIDTGRPLQEDITLKMKVTTAKYETAIAWLRDLLLGSHFAVDRLKISAVKALQNLPSEKRDGSDVSNSVFRQLVTCPDSTSSAMNLLTRAEFLPAFVARLKEEPEVVVKEFEAFRRSVIDPRSIRISVKGDILALPKPSSPWLTHFQFDKFDRSQLKAVTLGKDVLGTLGANPSRKLVVFGVSSIESCFGYHIARGPDSPTHPDQAALTVARSVLNAMESFLWKFIRGAGLAYGASIGQDLESGLVYYSVYKSPDSHAAYVAAAKLIDQLVSGEIEIDELTLESAKSSLAYNTAAKESTMNDAANASFVTQVLLGLPPAYGRIALARTKDISTDDVLRVIKQYIAPIFNPETSIGSIAAGTAKVDEMVESFTKLGYEVEKRSFGVDEDEDDEDEDDSGSEMSVDEK